MIPSPCIGWLVRITDVVVLREPRVRTTSPGGVHPNASTKLHEGPALDVDARMQPCERLVRAARTSRPSPRPERPPPGPAYPRPWPGQFGVTAQASRPGPQAQSRSPVAAATGLFQRGEVWQGAPRTSSRRRSLPPDSLPAIGRQHLRPIIPLRRLMAAGGFGLDGQRHGGLLPAGGMDAHPTKLVALQGTLIRVAGDFPAPDFVALLDKVQLLSGWRAARRAERS